MSDDQSPIPRALDSAAENTRAGAHADGFSRTTLPRLGVITGDRSCHACGFNLRGQPIVREQHYDMVMVRCPECAAVAPLLDYPRYSHWARRLWAFVALLWMSLAEDRARAGRALFEKISWPSQREYVGGTIGVLVIVAFMTAVLGVLDALLSAGFGWLVEGLPKMLNG